MPATLCPACKSNIPAKAESCTDCGYVVRQSILAAGPPAPVRICGNPHCQAANKPEATKCERCEQPLPMPPGTVLHGRFRLVKHIKSGGFGAVYLAADTDNKDRQVVVKEMIVPELAEYRKRLDFFKREAETLSLLNDKRLASVPRYYGTYQDEEKRSAHLILEFINGRNLLEVLEANGNRPIAFPLVLQWAKVLCDVLSVMHGQAPPRLHRDIKPENIMLLRDGRTIKMIDFGTAREVRLQPAAQKRSRLTVVYSEDYAPPEQRLPWPEPRSDLFALAATLYHLATGQLPRGIETATDLEPLLANPPANVPVWFLRLLHANLAVNVRERHPSILAFKEDLENQRVRSREELYPPQAEVPPARPAVVPPVPVTLPREAPSQEPAPPPPVVRDRPARGNPFGALVVVLLLLAGGAGVLGYYEGWFEQSPDELSQSGGNPSPGPTQARGIPTDPTPPPLEPSRPFTRRAATLALIRAQLEKTPVEDRRFQRFFTLDHLYNNPRHKREVLDEHRDALTHLLGQFSAKAPPPKVLGDGSVFQIDLRLLGWDRPRAWGKVMAAYPYGLGDPAVKNIMELAGNDHPFVRCDWFVDTASRDPLFSKLARPVGAEGGRGPQLTEAILKVRAIYQADLEPRDVALELGRNDPDKLRQEVQADNRLQELFARRQVGGFSRNEAVPRATWAAQDGLESAFQEVAVSLGIAELSIRQRE